MKRFSALTTVFMLSTAATAAPDTNPHFHDFERLPWKAFAPRELDFVGYVLRCGKAAEGSKNIAFSVRPGLELENIYRPGQTTNVGVGVSGGAIDATAVIITDPSNQVRYLYTHDRYGGSATVGSTTQWTVPAGAAEGTYSIQMCVVFRDGTVEKLTKTFDVKR